MLYKTFEADVQREFPRVWDFETCLASGLIAHSGPMTIELWETLPDPIGVFIEFPGIPSFDFRAATVAEAKEILVGLVRGLSGLLETKEESK